MGDLNGFLDELRAHGYEPLRPLSTDTKTWPRLTYNGEKPNKASGRYNLTVNPDGSYFAIYGSDKDSLGFRNWRSDRKREFSYHEISALKIAREKIRRFDAENQKKRFDLVGVRLSRALKNYPVAESHPYLSDKKILPHGIKIRPKTGELLVPRYANDGKIYGLQRIKQNNGGKSWKGYFKGAMSKGLFYPFFEDGDDLTVILFAEGFSTAASIRECTGLPVVCCFDAGGLLPVSESFKKKYPASRFIFCADNDIYENAKGVVQNTGLDKAKLAAVKIGGAHVIAPEFLPENQGDFPTDWNDAMILYGRDHVKDKIMVVVNAAPEIPQLNTEGEAPAGDVGDPLIPDLQVTGGEASYGDLGMNFRVLGYNNGIYYYYPFAIRQIVSLSAGAHTMNNLVLLESLDVWESKWRDNAGKLMAKHQTIALYAWAMLKERADKKGIFVEEDRVRGAGCWVDDGRVVLHCGDSLYVDGRKREFETLDSDFTYVKSSRLLKPASEPLSNADARKLRSICESITWENKLSGTLLSGWLVIAPICAALSYRPHIYITGEAESGKSTVMDRIIKPVIGKMAYRADGGTTEPAIREGMGYDARPIVYDEAEPNPSMTAVIDLARKATTGAVVKKFGQKPFKARFCACFSAINPPVNKTADESRISFMHLKKNRRATAAEEFDSLIAQIDDLITDDFSERLIARTLENMNSLIANIRIFQRAVRKSINGARASQQIGTMLAGVYLLGRTDIITEDAALEIVNRFNYSEHTIIDEAGDPIRLVQHIAGSLIVNRGIPDISIGELIIKCYMEKDAVADKLLRQYGIRIDADRVIIASTNQNLAKLLKDTDWHEKWNRTLTDVDGSQKHKIVHFAPGIKTSAVSVPVSLFTENEHTREPEPPIEF